MSPRRTLVAATAFLGLVFAGSAASAVPVPIPGHGVESDGPELRERLRTQFDRSFSGLKLPELRRTAPEAPAPSTSITSVGSADPFPGLPPGQSAAYGSATVNHTAASLSEGLGQDVNLASAHAAHTGGALPAWKSEIGREAFPAMAAGSSQGKGLAAEIGPSDGDEGDSQLPLEPAVSKAPPTGSPAFEETPINVPPALQNRALRAEAFARAIKTGCVLGTDLAFGQANADETDVGNLSNDESSPEPFLSVNAGTPQRAVAQSLARARLLPVVDQPGRFGLLAETRQTVAPVTLFRGDRAREITIEIAGEWVLRAFADGREGVVTLDVEKAVDDNRPLLRIISRDQSGRPSVTAIGDLDELGRLNRDGIQFGPGLELFLAEDPRGLRAAAGTQVTATGTRAAGALDILRIQDGENPEDAIVRVGHMEVAVAVPSDGVSCPGIGVSKRSSQPAVDAGNRFSWLLNVSNPNDCILDKVKLVDTTEASRGLRYKVVATSPPAKISGDTLVIEGIGPLPPGTSRAIRIDVEVDRDSPPGRFTNQAVASGLCGGAVLTGEADNETEVEPPPPLSLIGRTGANEPVVRTAGSSDAAQGPGEGGPLAAPAGDVVVRPAPLVAGATETRRTRMSPVSSAPASAGGTRTASGALARTGASMNALLGLSTLGIGLLLRRARRRF